MAGFDTKERNNRGEYEITFYTEDYIQFKKVENLCRELIGHAKPIMPQHDNLKDKLFDEAVEELASKVTTGNFFLTPKKGETES